VHNFVEEVFRVETNEPFSLDTYTIRIYVSMQRARAIHSGPGIIAREYTRAMGLNREEAGRVSDRPLRRYARSSRPWPRPPASKEQNCISGPGLSLWARARERTSKAGPGLRSLGPGSDLRARARELENAPRRLGPGSDLCIFGRPRGKLVASVIELLVLQIWALYSSTPSITRCSRYT